MTTTTDCRLLCAATCAYDITASGNFTAVSPHYPVVGWKAVPTPYVAGADDINGCLIGTNLEDGIVLAFRGTLPPTSLNIPPQVRDWMQDFLAEPVAKPGSLPNAMKVHDGFWKAVDSLWPQMLPAVQELLASETQPKLYIAGHSKGGAMAAIAAARLFTEENIVAAGVYMYAAPRAGNSTFVLDFPSAIPVFRYEHYLDIVPFLPPNLQFIDLIAEVPMLGDLLVKATGWDYTSLGTLRYIKQDGTIVGDNPHLNLVRSGEILGQAMLGHWLEIARAHAPWCQGPLSDGGYMRGVCPTGLCDEFDISDSRD
ncbi:MAG: lipase family protein [Terriglobia bacterium]|jgi:hypothetical protein